MCAQFSRGYETFFTCALFFQTAGHIDPLIDATALATRHADVVFIGAENTFDTVFEVPEAGWLNRFGCACARQAKVSAISALNQVLMSR